jgi:SAM-dependent methyltransferase
MCEMPIEQTEPADNPLRGRFNAWLLDLLDAYMHRQYGTVKRRLFAPVPPRVVDLGAGAGANFRYFPAGTTVVAIEPNRRMHARLARKAQRHGLTLELHATGGEALDLADSSVDLVCASLVLCTVRDPAAVLREVRRILRPGGRFAAIEHVPAPLGSGLAALQRTIHAPWRWVFEGCNLLNETEAVLRAGGFRAVQIESLHLRTVFLPLRYQVAVHGVV